MENITGNLKHTQPEAYPLDALAAELERQAEIYKGLGVSKDVIMGLLAPRPENLPPELSIPVVTLGSSVDLDTMESFSQIRIRYNKGLILGDISGGITYPEPHLIWMHDGSENLDQSPEYVIASMLPNARPATLTDGIALAMLHPEIIDTVWNKHIISLPGTDLGRNALLCLVQNRKDESKKSVNIEHVFDSVSSPDEGSALSGN